MNTNRLTRPAKPVLRIRRSTTANELATLARQVSHYDPIAEFFGGCLNAAFGRVTSRREQTGR